MSDITLCSNKSCPIKRSCKRHTATPNKYWQATQFHEFKREKDGSVTCDSFYSNGR